MVIGSKYKKENYNAFVKSGKCQHCRHKWWLHYISDDERSWICMGESGPCGCVRPLYVLEGIV